ncbi:cytochrome P450 [Stakelama tenebrarum]|uniref:Cytochrome P450 n=1 Tax=Stakelama tenebrarum TaxID=2711215 RepID=A0A6G6Y7Q0_9SPHN|nr:cytochrome P450 [Sphingosinithalassobacter tenebrarum]QIG80738.1 cytochrome P450 [Sphingosinithalassobacter tenebrarum]
MSEAATLSPAVERPDHVPESVCYDFDLFNDPEYREAPHERILGLIEQAPPVFWTPRNGGHWMIVSHKANFEASRDTEIFSSEVIPAAQIKAMMASMPADMPRVPMAVPINLDPPEHTKYRAPLQKTFSPKAMAALKGDIRKLAGELIDSMKPKGKANFMTEVAEPMPVQVFLKMFGLPLDRQAEYRKLVEEHLAAISLDAASMAQRMIRCAAIMRDTILERRDNPQDDIISMLWQTEIDGRPMTIEDMENYAVLLFIAGLDTVMNGMGHGVHRLASDLELQARLRAEPKLIPEAAEELLRRYTFTVPVRRVTRDIEFHGAPMQANDRAMLFLPGADLDPTEYKNPAEFNMKRENNVHIAFGGGPHRCLGSHLARIELQILYEELLARMPEFRLDPEHKVTYHGGHVIGPDALWLTWEA